jgi:hypothetical protein
MHCRQLLMLLLLLLFLFRVLPLSLLLPLLPLLFLPLLLLLLLLLLCRRYGVPVVQSFNYTGGSAVYRAALHLHFCMVSFTLQKHYHA